MGQKTSQPNKATDTHVYTGTKRGKAVSTPQVISDENDIEETNHPLVTALVIGAGMVQTPPRYFFSAHRGHILSLRREKCHGGVWVWRSFGIIRTNSRNCLVWNFKIIKNQGV